MVWLIGAISLVLPWVGGGAILLGLYEIANDIPRGRLLVMAGCLLIALDIASDIWLSRMFKDSSDEPGLNARGAREVGRTVVLDQPIVAGRGRIRMHDSVWTVEGPDLPAGATVRIIARRSAVLVVVADPGASKAASRGQEAANERERPTDDGERGPSDGTDSGQDRPAADQTTPARRKS